MRSILNWFNICVNGVFAFRSAYESGFKVFTGSLNKELRTIVDLEKNQLLYPIFNVKP